MYKKVKDIIIDFDGVLTDGKIFYDHNGNQFKGTHSRDVRALRELVHNGFTVTILTASSWAGATIFAERSGCILNICKDKELFITKLIEENGNNEIIAVGDDVWDFKMLEKVKFPFAPSDCDAELLKIKGLQLTHKKGGEGVISELVRKICNCQNNL